MMEGTNTAANKVANTAGLAGLRDKLNLKLGAYNEAVKNNVLGTWESGSGRR